MGTWRLWQRLLWKEARESWPVLGIGLALPFPGFNGSVLVIPARRPRVVGLCLRARVVRSALKDYVWFHGCEFLTPLSAAELGRWLEEFRGEGRPSES